MTAMDMRQYDPAIARWVVQDPVIHHSMSSYNAFDNNPVFWADPSGADSAPGFNVNNGVVYGQGHWSDGLRAEHNTQDSDESQTSENGTDPPAKRDNSTATGIGKGVINYAVDSFITYSPVYGSIEQIGKIFDEDFELISRIKLNEKEKTSAFYATIFLAIIEPGPGGEAKLLKNSGWISRKIFNSLDPKIADKFVKAIEKGIVAPTGKQGIIKLTASEVKAMGGAYTHKLKILPKGGGGDMRIYGKQQANGHFVFDLLKRH